MANLALNKLLTTLRNQQTNTPYNYTVPDLWNCFDYPEDNYIKTPSHELIVNPYDFYSYLIENVLLNNVKDAINPSTSVAMNTSKHTNGDWIKESVMYSSFLRTSSAWDHDRSGTLEDKNIYSLKETGTFVKTLALLPLLKKMGVTALYLLPISTYSKENIKGELGSPYAVTHFTELDAGLKDPMTGDAMTLEEEFSALIEGCHLLNIRVIIDIIPRTNSTESALIKTHPDWFYWIDADAEYKVPHINGIGPVVYPEPEFMPQVFKEKDVLRHLNQFKHDPLTQDKALFNKIKNNKNLKASIKKHFNLKVAPAFSDWINDNQPPWTDVTYFRIYLDHPKETKGYLPNVAHPPYILFDTIKANMYPGNKPNMPLWETLAYIIPTFQKKFGIDGARIDMGHALPKPLLKMIMAEAKKIDPDFAFIAEELNPPKALDAKKLGYNIIVGNGFYKVPRIYENKTLEHYLKSVDIPLPVLACSETHDTARIASRHGGEIIAKATTLLNMFMPNGVPFINSGQENYEKQPMNLGIDCTDLDLYHNDETDPFYKKLALFDRYQFHYTNPRRWELPDLLDQVKPIRKKYLKQITNSKAFFPLETENKQFIGFGYVKKGKATSKNILLVLGNVSPDHECKVALDITKIRTASNNKTMLGKLHLSTHEFPRDFTQFIDLNTLDIHLGKGEVKIVEL